MIDLALEALLRRVVREEVAAALTASVRPTKPLSIPAFAKLCGVHASTVRRAIADGRLAVQHVGKTVRIAPDAVIAPPAKTERGEPEAAIAARAFAKLAVCK